MARTTISIPDDLKAEMDKLANSVNWSATAASAFRAEVSRAKIHSQKLEGKKMSAALKRLQQSKETYEANAVDRGRSDGLDWAMQGAEYGELKSLAESWAGIETTDTNDALGAPGVFMRMIREQTDRSEISEFWLDLGHEATDPDQYSCQYWDGFVVGALEVFAKLEY